MMTIAERQVPCPPRVPVLSPPLPVQRRTMVSPISSDRTSSRRLSACRASGLQRALYQRNPVDPVYHPNPIALERHRARSIIRWFGLSFATAQGAAGCARAAVVIVLSKHSLPRLTSHFACQVPWANPVGPTDRDGRAGVAQLVERHLAKVVVVGSNPITRSFCIYWKHESESQARA